MTNHCLCCGKNICRVSTRCKSCAKKGNLNNKWKGGIIDRGGYIYIYAPKHPRGNSCGYIAEHVHIMEQKIGRFLEYYGLDHPKTETIHHINGDKKDNRIENLQLLLHREHRRRHMMGNKQSVGRKLSEEQKKAISIYQKGKITSQETRNKISLVKKELFKNLSKEEKTKRAYKIIGKRNIFRDEITVGIYRISITASQLLGSTEIFID